MAWAAYDYVILAVKILFFIVFTGVFGLLYIIGVLSAKDYRFVKRRLFNGKK